MVTAIFLYLFCRIVGDDDGGELFTPEQYDEYKKNVLPMVGQINNISHIFVHGTRICKDTTSCTKYLNINLAVDIVKI